MDNSTEERIVPVCAKCGEKKVVGLKVVNGVQQPMCWECIKKVEGLGT